MVIYNDFCKKIEVVFFVIDIVVRGFGEYLFCFFFYKSWFLLIKRLKEIVNKVIVK